METANRQDSELQVSTKAAVVAKDIQCVTPLKPRNAGPPCYRCGKTGDLPDKCYFKSQKCRAFGRGDTLLKCAKQRSQRKEL